MPPFLVLQPGPYPEFAVVLAQDLDAFEACAAEIRKFADDPSVPHQMAMLVDYRRSLDVAREGRRGFEAVMPPSPAISLLRRTVARTRLNGPGAA